MSSASLTGIPREIRDLIYDLVYQYEEITPLRWPGENYPEHVFSSPGSPSIDPQELLALTLVSHQISVEAMATFYGKTEFQGTLLELDTFFKNIGQQRRNFVRCARLDLSFGDLLGRGGLSISQWWEVGSLTHLRTLTIEGDYDMEFMKEMKDWLYNSGVEPLIGRVSLIVHERLEKLRADYEEFLRGEHSIIESTTWTCAAGETQWKIQGREWRGDVLKS